MAKPLDGMGGKSIFAIQKGDKNANVIFETLTEDGTRFAMAQVFVPEITAGDKRILLIDGEAVPFALARIPVGRRPSRQPRHGCDRGRPGAVGRRQGHSANASARRCVTLA